VLGGFGDANYLIEIKQTEPSLVAQLLATVEASRLRRRVLIASEFDEPISMVRSLAPQIPTNFPYGEVAEFLQALAGNRPGYEPRGAALQIPPEYQGWRLVTTESVEFAHRAGVELHVWTVNEESEMNRLLECDVDGLISDFPARALAVARSRGR
jgi:glycerophosphoryl diester phosphodiesterase